MGNDGSVGAMGQHPRTYQPEHVGQMLAFLSGARFPGEEGRSLRGGGPGKGLFMGLPRKAPEGSPHKGQTGQPASGFSTTPIVSWQQGENPVPRSAGAWRRVQPRGKSVNSTPQSTQRKGLGNVLHGRRRCGELPEPNLNGPLGAFRRSRAPGLFHIMRRPRLNQCNFLHRAPLGRLGKPKRVLRSRK